MDLRVAGVKSEAGGHESSLTRMQRLFKAAAIGWFAMLGAAGIAHAQDAKEAFAPEQVARGAKLFAQNCEVCHGPKMVDPGGGFFDLRTFPKHQRTRFFNSVSNGKNSMPPWKSLLSQEEIGDLWSYVVTGEAQ